MKRSFILFGLLAVVLVATLTVYAVEKSTWGKVKAELRKKPVLRLARVRVTQTSNRDVPVDIKPASCPNPLNIDNRGVLPVAILGTEDLSVTDIEPATILLEGVSPLRWDFKDVATPFEPFTGKEDCNEDCTEEGPDGHLDLTLKFDAQAVIAALGKVKDGQCLVLELTGALKNDGTDFVGEDVVMIVECKWQLGLVTDVGGIDDKSFNEAAWNGVEEGAAALGLGEGCYGYIEGQDPKDYIPNIESFVEEGANIIVTSGFTMAEATNKMAAKHSDVYLIGIDQWYEEPQDNLAGLVFNEDEAGFLAGCLACLMTDSNIIGGVYGPEFVPPVVYFREGYENGAKYCNPNVEVLGAYHPAGFNDPEWGHETAASMIVQGGADVIFGAGGETGNGGVEEAALQGVWCIGVDVDQYYTLPAFVRPYLLSSAMKMITPGIVDLIKAIDAGTFEGGQVLGSVALAPYHDTEKKIPKQVKDKIAEVTKGIQDGSISTGVEK